MAHMEDQPGPSPLGSLGVLDADAMRCVLCALPGASLVRLAACSRAFAHLIDDSAVWASASARDHADVEVLVTASPGPARYAQGAALSSLSTVAWVASAGRGAAAVFPPREGSAAAVVQGALFVVGGWTALGLAGDVLRLRVEETGAITAQRLAVASHLPPRYGHSATAAGEGRAAVIVYAGMYQGGYMGETDDVRVLRLADSATAPDAPAWEWVVPRVSGPLPPARGYHAAAATPDGRLLFVHGGIADSAPCADLHCLDTQTWSWAPVLPATPAQPGPRFGHSMLVAAGGLWLFGGAFGGALRDGPERADIWRLDLATRTWAPVVAEAPAGLARQALGRCHTSTLVGAKVLFFGGSLRTSADVVTFDLHTAAWGVPRVAGSPIFGPARLAPFSRPGGPAARLSHLAGLLGDTLVMAAGWNYRLGGHGLMGDVWQLRLAPSPEQREAAVAPGPWEEADSEDEEDLDEEEGWEEAEEGSEGSWYEAEEE